MDPYEWLSELGGDDSDLINQCQMKSNKSINNYCFNPHSGSYSAHPSSSAESIQESYKAGMAKSTNNDFSSYTSVEKESQRISAFASCNIISFGDFSSSKSEMQDQHRKGKCNVKIEEPMLSVGEIMNFSAKIPPSFIYEMVEYGEPIKKTLNRTPLQAQDHVLAKRKRRERLSEKFVALSAMIPDLKKRKQEESLNISSVSKRPQLASFDEISSSDVLVRVYCEKRSGIIKEILGEIEKLRLGIISTSIIPFGSSTLSSTAIAQMESEDFMRAQEIANAMRMVIQRIMP